MRKVAVLLACVLALSLGAAGRPVAAATTTAEVRTVSAAPAAPCGTPGAPTTTIFLPNITKMLGGPNGFTVTTNTGLTIVKSFTKTN